MRKFLLLFVSLFIMTGAFANVSLDLTTATYGQWGEDDTYVINEDGTVTLTFVGAWTGTGWQNWGEPWDLTQYKSVVVEYKDLVGGEGNEDHPWIQLYIGSNPAIGQNDWGQSGRIEFVMADNVYVLDEDGNPTETVYDYSSVGQIMIQSNGALSVTITSVTFVEEDTGDDDGDTDNDTDELPIDNDWDLASGWNSSYDGATHTITYEVGWAGRGWWFGDPDTRDCSEYDGVEVVLKTDIAATINLVVQYNYYPEVTDDDEDPEALTTIGSITGSGTGEEQTLYCALDPDMADKVIQIWIQSSEAGQVELVSARFVKDSGEEPTPDPEPATEEKSIDITANIANWNELETYEINADGTVTFSYTDAWQGEGWTSWNDRWDLTQYKSVVLEYTDLVALDGNEHPWIQLYIGSDPSIGQGDWGQSGRIEFVMADNVYVLDEEDNPTETVYDYSSVGQIMVQPSCALSVTILSLTFVPYGDEPEPTPAEGENLWDAVEDGTAYEGVYEYWATGDSWDLIYEGTSTGNSGEYWSRDADAKTWTVTMPENAGGTIWQDQVHIRTSLPVVGGTEYSFGCSLLCDVDGAATIKLVDSGDDGDFFFDDLHTLVAGEVYNYVAQGVTMGDADSVKLVFDFAGTPGGAVITICNIAFNEGNELVDTGIEEVAPVAAPVAKKGIYNLAGQRVNANAKGLLIIDGKKVLVK